MKFKHILVSYVIPIFGVGGVLFGYNQIKNNKSYLCKHEYALCTSAKCVPQADDPTKATCLCDVEKGPSMSTVACNILEPTTNRNGIRILYSTFSFQQLEQGKKGMKCPSGTPWTWCLNKRCTVEPSDPDKAICVCDVMRTGEWMTLGGGCDPSTCETGYWSGATLEDDNEATAFMRKALGLDNAPMKWCPEESE